MGRFDNMPSKHTSRRTALPMVFTMLLITLVSQYATQATALGAVASHHDHTGFVTILGNLHGSAFSFKYQTTEGSVSSQSITFVCPYMSSR